VRSILIAFCILLSALGTAQDKQISYKTVAVPLWRALKEISDQNGLKLVASGDLQNEPIILSFNSATASDVMSHIAAAMNAEWNPAKDGYQRLERSEVQIMKLNFQATQARSKLFADALKIKQQEQAKLKPFTRNEAANLAAAWATFAVGKEENNDEREWQSRQRVSTQMPDQRALWKILGAMDPMAIASVPPGSRAVFSTRPSKMQSPLPESIVEVVPTWADEHNALTEELNRVLAGRTIHEFPADEGDALARMPSNPFQVDLAVSSSDDGMFISLALFAFDDHGNPIAGVTNSLNLFEGKFNQRPAVKDPNPTLIPLSEPSQELVDLTMARYANKPLVASQSLRELLLHPETHEPLSTLASDALLFQAEHEGKNLAANPEDAFNLDLCNSAAMTKGIRQDQLLYLIDLFTVATRSAIDRDDHWIVLHSINPDSSDRARMDRRALGEFLRTIDGQGYASINDWARLASACQSKRPPYLVNTDMYLLSEPADSGNAMDLMDFLRFYNTLDPKTIDYMLQGNSVRIADLTAESADALSTWIYQNADMSSGGAAMEIGKPFMTLLALHREPIELLPNGIPSDATITFSKDVDKKLFIQTSMYGMSRGYTGTINDVANTIVRQKHPELQRAGANETFTGVCPAEDHVLHVTFKCPSGYQRQLDCKETIKQGSPGPIADLPADLRNQIDKLVTEMLDSMAGSVQTPEPHQDSKPPR